jgi:hypothetical protein
MTLSRVKVVNQGSPGGNAATNFYFSTVGTTELNALGTFITAIKAYIPSSITFVVPSTGDIINESDGTLSGSWSATAPAPIIGTGSGMAGTPIGVEIAWLAAAVVDGHRPVGKTLIVPAAAGAINSSGVVAPATVTAVNAAAATFLATAVNFKIWHRPRKASPGPPPVTFRPGLGMTPAGGTTRTPVAVLRSRRQ